MTGDEDTIAAIATAAGRGGVGIIRISGRKAREISTLITGSVPLARRAEYLPFCNKQHDVLDQGIVLFFESPHSFTGEDVIELQGHGGPVVMDMILKCVIDAGCRLARPGEFSERAFHNGKMDLAQAEAIADLIDSTSEQAARSAVRSLQGQFSQHVKIILDKLIHLRMYVEAAIDFPEEEIDFITEGDVKNQLVALLDSIEILKKNAVQGSLLREGMTLVIAGSPNAGKSSLMNALAKRDAAIVTDIPGTTRDVLREHITLDGMPLNIIDTAGICNTEDVVEKIGIQRAQEEIKKADSIILLIDDSKKGAAQTEFTLDELKALVPASKNITLVYNKIDITGSKPAIKNFNNETEIFISVQTGQGMDLLIDHLKCSVGFDGSGSDGIFMARRRHLDSIDRAHDCVQKGMQQLESHSAAELLANDLFYAQQALGEITGEFSNDDLLGEIFSGFCIGK